MDKDNGNSEDGHVESGSSTSIRNSLVGKRDIAKRPREIDDDKQSSSDSNSSPCRHKKRKKMKKSKKNKKHLKKRKRQKNYNSDSSFSSEKESVDKKRSKKKRKHKSSSTISTQESAAADDSNEFGPALPEELIAKSKAMAPMSKEEWEKRQSTIKRVFDEDSGRYRLIRGDGEIIEECVSRDRHRQINKQATAADGMYFQKYLTKK